MTNPIGSHELPLVPPREFSRRMKDHWTGPLKGCATAPLEQLWTAMAEYFNETIIDQWHEVPNQPWRILQPPTGTGKTRGACLFLAMQAELNASSDTPIGSIIVTRLVKDADKIAAEINAHAGRAVAIAHHAQDPKSFESIQSHDTVVITHQACVSASESLKARKGIAYERLCLWRRGKRLLTIIDEALANTVDDVKVTADNISEVQRYITLDLEKTHERECAALAILKGLLVTYGNTGEAASVVLSEGINSGFGDEPLVHFGALRSDMKLIDYDRLGAHMQDSDVRLDIWRKVDKTLERCQALYDQYFYYAKKGTEHSLNSSSLAVPWGIPGPVVLDATARAEVLWDLLGKRTRIEPTPSHTRDYSAATLHIARCDGVGKRSMGSKFGDRFARLAADLEQRLPSSSSVFLCTHQINEASAIASGMAFDTFSVGHWGAVDGSNDWADYDTAVIFGLPYRDHTWAHNTFFATQGVQTNDWIKEPRWKEHADARSMMIQRQISVAVIQAINRIRLRRVVDEAGRCLSANVFVVLPNGETGDAILKSIIDDMPGLQIANWAFEMDGAKVRRPRKGSSHAALLAMMKGRLPGRTPMTKVARDLGLKTHALRALREVLNNPLKDLTKALSAMGVEYLVEGAGRGRKSFLVKHHAA